MSVMSKRTKTTTRHEYAVPMPACWTDIKFAMQQAADDRRDKGLKNHWDDVIKVDHDDENIVVFWEEVA
jgi:hypothetical protein